MPGHASRQSDADQQAQARERVGRSIDVVIRPSLAAKAPFIYAWPACLLSLWVNLSHDIPMIETNPIHAQIADLTGRVESLRGYL